MQFCIVHDSMKIHHGTTVGAIVTIHRFFRNSYMYVVNLCRNHRIKRVVPYRCRTDTLKNPAKCLWRWEPDVVGTTSSSVRLHIYAVTYMTEILLIVT